MCMYVWIEVVDLIDKWHTNVKNILIKLPMHTDVPNAVSLERRHISVVSSQIASNNKNWLELLALGVENPWVTGVFSW